MGVMLFAALLAVAASEPDCRAELERVTEEARTQGYEAVEGPYEVGPGDLRAHAVSAENGGHRIVEYRCEEGRVVSRSWAERPAGAGNELTPLETLLRDAEWRPRERGE